MPLVDQLAAVLADLVLGPAEDRPAAPADARGMRLVALGGIARRLEPIGARGAGEPGAADRDPRRRRPSGRLGEAARRRGRRRGGTDGAGTNEELAARRPLLEHLLDGNLSRPRLPDRRDGLLEPSGQRRASHVSPPRWVYDKHPSFRGGVQCRLWSGDAAARLAT